MPDAARHGIVTNFFARAGSLTAPARNFNLARVKAISYRRRLAGMAAVVSLLVATARGGDLVTLSGTVYHDAEAIHVDPDGVTYQYDEGQCKVDFNDLSPGVRQTYHYDPAKAAAYHDMLAKGRQEAEARKQQVLQENDGRHRARMQAEAAASLSRVNAGADTIFRRAQSPAASEATKALGAEVAAAVGKGTPAPASDSKTVMALRKVESTLVTLGIIHFSHPAEVSNPDEFKADLHHAPNDSTAGGVQDAFSEPIYLTKSYNEDVDRSTAFLNDAPLKP